MNTHLNPIWPKVVQPIISVFLYFPLLREFVYKDIKGRFAGSIGGIFWALITPVSHILVYSFIFSAVMRIQIDKNETGTDSFFVFFLSGYFLWMILSETLSRASGIIIENSALVTKVVFPVELLPISILFSAIVMNGIGYGIYLLFLVYNGFFHLLWFLLIPIFLLYCMFVFGISAFISAFCVFFRDAREIIALFLMIWFYATPIIYPISMIPEGFAWVAKLNPVFCFIDITRNIIFFRQISFNMLAETVCFTLFFYCTGSWFFMKSRSAFGDVL